MGWGSALPYVGHRGSSTPIIGHVMRNVCTQGATARGRGDGPSLRCIGGSLRPLNARYVRVARSCWPALTVPLAGRLKGIARDMRR